METVYEYKDSDGDRIEMSSRDCPVRGIDITSNTWVFIPDAEIPNLITALQRHLGDPDGWLWG